MPYITQNYRDQLYQEIDALAQKIKQINEQNPGQTKDGLMNFALTELMNEVFPNARYHQFNEIIGFLECCKLEYYRKKIGPYEDLKEQENGPVRQFDKQEKSGY